MYRALNHVHAEMGDKGVTVVAFPSATFNQEYSSSADVAEFCRKKGVEFPVLEITDVNGGDTNEAYQLFKAANPGDISWNFSTIFVVHKDGTKVERHDKAKPDALLPHLSELVGGASL